MDRLAGYDASNPPEQAGKFGESQAERDVREGRAEDPWEVESYDPPEHGKVAHMDPEARHLPKFVEQVASDPAPDMELPPDTEDVAALKAKLELRKADITDLREDALQGFILGYETALYDLQERQAGPTVSVQVQTPELPKCQRCEAGIELLVHDNGDRWWVHVPGAHPADGHEAEPSEAVAASVAAFYGEDDNG